MTRIFAAVLFSPAMVVVVAAASVAQPSPHGVDVEKLLDSVPITLETYGSVREGYQYIDDIPRNLKMLYNVVCVLESPHVGKDRSDTFPSLEMDYVPLDYNEETTLREFLDTTCSDGKLAWAVVRNAIHICPVKETEKKATYLDTVAISLDLAGVSMLDAVKAWATALNTNRKPVGHGVGVKHIFSLVDMRNHVTPPSMITPGTVTVKMEDVTAREALCAILGASAQMNWITYHHLTSRRDSVTLHVTEAERALCAEITPEERAVLNAQENLESVLVEPAMAGEQR
jgi:hypothetical protein